MERFALESRFQRRAPEDLPGRDGSGAASDLTRQTDHSRSGGPARGLQPLSGHGGSAERRPPSCQGRRDSLFDCPRVPDHRRGPSSRESLSVQPAAAGWGYADDSSLTLDFTLRPCFFPLHSVSSPGASRARLEPARLRAEPTHAWMFFWGRAIAKKSREGENQSGRHRRCLTNV
jgi:hypothetical protein